MVLFLAHFLHTSLVDCYLTNWILNIASLVTSTYLCTWKKVTFQVEQIVFRVAAKEKIFVP